MEIVTLDTTGRKHRFHFSSKFRESDSKALHAQIPLRAKCEWTHIILNLAELSTEHFGVKYASVDSICLSPCCRIRKVFTVPSVLITGDMYDCPAVFDFPAGTNATWMILPEPPSVKIEEQPELLVSAAPSRSEPARSVSAKKKRAALVAVRERHKNETPVSGNADMQEKVANQIQPTNNDDIDFEGMVRREEMKEIKASETNVRAEDDIEVQYDEVEVRGSEEAPPSPVLVLSPIGGNPWKSSILSPPRSARLGQHRSPLSSHTFNGTEVGSDCTPDRERRERIKVVPTIPPSPPYTSSVEADNIIPPMETENSDRGRQVLINRERSAMNHGAIYELEKVLDKIEMEFIDEYGGDEFARLVQS
eukprot:CAMPEP_0185023786 /NCGR_PEP_ID=MMETSP1103-20130426/6413_1 /TAXON_ID=36769 /ORGANISM="Paraphysomonas bandaiensis, Strain Caron Lab Isolate" /LENGTH=363 /DNA_ID=CAMNT_0027556531 /DNA_START=188 /DNA_END=1279 /DNA_ORIENTATION=-